MSELKMRDALITAREFLVLEGNAEDNLAIVKIDEALAQQPNHPEIPESSPEQPAAVVKIPDQLYDSYAVFKRAEAACPSLQGHQVRHVLDAVVALIREANQEKGHAEPT